MPFVSRSLRAAPLALAALALALPSRAAQEDEPEDGERPVNRHPVTILVTQPVGDAGVPNCRIDVLDYSVLEKEWGLLKITPTFYDWEELRASHAQTYTTNDHGTVIVPRPEKQCYVTASAPGMWCFFQLDSTDVSPFILKLEPDLVLRALVVDEQGRPVAGVHVGVSIDLKETIKTETDMETVMWQTGAKTGPDGIALLPHMQQWRQYKWWRVEPDKELDGPRRLWIAEALPKFVRPEIEVWSEPTAPVKLVLPPTGKVVIPVPTGLRTYARVRKALPGVDFNTRPWPMRQPYRVEGQDGRATFDHVGLNLDLDYEVWWEGLRSPRRGKAAGPKQPGEVVELPPLHGSGDHRAPSADAPR